MKRKTTVLALSAALALLLAGCKDSGKRIGSDEGEGVTVQKVWGDGNRHCAFTSIIEFKGKYYLAFREAESHIFDADGEARGATRILVSSDGEKWESAAYLTEKGIDLRDPKLSITPDGRLMVIIGGSEYVNKALVGRCSRVSFSEDGKTFTEPRKIQINSKTCNGTDWLWRVDWLDGTGYGVIYSILPGEQEPAGQTAAISLVRTIDGINWEDVANIDLPGFPNETTVRFLPDKRMAMMVREDAGDCLGYWGVSNPPYTEWTFKKMDMRIGGPDFIVKDKNTVIAGTRDYRNSGGHTTVIRKGTFEGEFTDVVTLPSGGDTSYPGLVKVGKQLWVSYYSSHETQKAAIYLAKMPLKMFD